MAEAVSKGLDYLYSCSNSSCSSEPMSLAEFTAHISSKHNGGSHCCPLCPRVNRLSTMEAVKHLRAQHQLIAAFLPVDWPQDWHPFLPSVPRNRYVVHRADRPTRHVDVNFRQEGPVFCSYCRQYAGSFHQLLIHMQLYHNSTTLRFRCPEPCVWKDEMKTFSALNKHLAERHSNLSSECADDRAKYLCVFCDSSLPKEQRVEDTFPGALNHLRQLHGRRDFFFQCPVCPFVLLGGEVTLRYHLKTYHGSQFIRAYEEGVLPIYFENMDENLLVVQCVKEASEGEGEGEGKEATTSRFSAHGNFCCGHCLEHLSESHKIFSNDFALERHLKECKRGPKSATMTCLLCQSQDLSSEEQTFTDIKRLKDHVEEHLKSYRKNRQIIEVRWQCRVENCKFSVTCDLKDIINHVEAVHGLTRESGAVWLRCPFCNGVQSADASTLERHLRISHALNPQRLLNELAITSIPVALRGEDGCEAVPFVPLFSSRKLMGRPKPAEEEAGPKVANVTSEGKKKVEAKEVRSERTNGPAVSSADRSGTREAPSESLDVVVDSQILVPKKSFFNIPNYASVSS